MKIDIDKIRSRLAWYQYYKVEDVKKHILRTVSYTAMVVVWAFIFSSDTMRKKIMGRVGKCDFYGREFDRDLLQSLMNAHTDRNTLDDVDVHNIYAIADKYEQEARRISGAPTRPELGYGYRMHIDNILSLEPIDEALIDKALDILELETHDRQKNSSVKGDVNS